MSSNPELDKRPTRRVVRLAGLIALALALVAPAAHAGNKLGGGAITGVMQYGAPGVPQPLAPGPPKCSMAVTFSASAGAMVLDTQIVGYAGPVTISNQPGELIEGGAAQGVSQTNCETFLLGSGRLSLDLKGYNQVNGARIACDNINGTWIRALNAIEIALNGPCRIGGAFTTSTIAFIGAMSHVADPMDVGGGVTHPFNSATVNGGFVITPG